MENLDLKTLERVKLSFDIMSDHSTKCHGYRVLCDLIEKTKQEDEKPKIYEEKLKIYNRAKRTMDSDLTWKDKYDIIFSEHISRKVDFKWFDPDGNHEDDLRAYMLGFDEYMERERIIHEQIDIN